MIPEITVRRGLTGDVRADRDWRPEVAAWMRTHCRVEGKALAAYKELADGASDEGIRYLTELILQDEERHHRVIVEMLRRVDSEVHEVDLEPAVPGGVHPDEELLARTRELLDMEKQDARELHHLQRQLRREPSTSLLPLLVDLMIHDTAKHIEILRFIVDARA